MTQKSLLPYDGNYALIHKRTLLVNSMVLTAMTEFISQNSSITSEQLALLFGETANKIVAAMSDETVNANACGLISKSIINNGVSSFVEYHSSKE